jgi:hypothetical protein
MVVAALYDKPYARKVKKYSYCYVPVGAFLMQKSRWSARVDFVSPHRHRAVKLFFKNRSVIGGLARPNACWIIGKRVILIG